tara:strand:- start:379 stop:633 length:255 start_codon:yes stop_codon:yes gene_type:complete
VVLVEHINPVVALPFYNDRVGNGSNMPPPRLDTFAGIFVEAPASPDIMRLGALVDLKEMPNVLYLLNDRFFRQVIVVVINGRSG